MKLAWLLLLSVLRTCYLFYSLWCLFFIPAIGVLIYAEITHQLPTYWENYHLNQIGLGITALLLVAIPLVVFSKHSKGDPNPFQSGFMSWFGTLRWFWNATASPMVKLGLPSGYLVENPMGCRLTGDELREILNALQPGDILLRAYDGYMDGEFIKHSSLLSNKGYRAGWFTHAAIFGGTLTDQDKEKVPAEFRNNQGFFKEGTQMVLHSMAKGVHCEDILTWCRCDYLAIVRIKSDLQFVSPVTVHEKKYRRSYQSDAASAKIKQELIQGKTIDRAEVIQTAKLSALEKIGEPYDFECIETDKFNSFSCAELVYFCFRSVHDALGLNAEPHAFFPFGKLLPHVSMMRRTTVTPDDYYDLTKSHHLELVWVDKVTKLNK
jgi:hypothetical protein